MHALEPTLNEIRFRVKRDLKLLWMFIRMSLIYMNKEIR